MIRANVCRNPDTTKEWKAMTDLNELSQKTDTSVEILQAIVDQQGDDPDRIEETLENPEDFDSLIARARERAKDKDAALKWQGRQIL
jgi:cytochrome oxidase Cu insertion factor (SCO1/SenC/PrrC family)